jgi:hypothetical protein
MMIWALLILLAGLALLWKGADLLSDGAVLLGIYVAYLLYLLGSTRAL